ncbi:hypothetical protein [Aeromonas dhakensis]|uniref:hypothetical protein n=1 Tax=Aeromonas dhakensis TaxID=196024 RepID=UPI000F54AE5E|nr:hypothetical protein [Aeromonas dhakensis]RQM79953.1 hypothetical protein EHZ77_19425 [Aeromonas dhakensis]
MLQAILSSKAGRIGLKEESLRWRDVFQRSEDLLTATFFGRVPYLSDGALSALLAFMIGRSVELSGFEELELWPHLKNSSAHKVEPDVVLHFKRELFVIEVKPPFGGTQSRQQWRDQIDAVQRDKAYAKHKKIYFIALGNVVPAVLAQSALPTRFEPMAACEWEALLNWLRQNTHFSTRQDKAILRDWQNAFELFGMAPMIPDWQPMVDMSKSIDPAAGLEQLQYWR